MDTLGEIQLSAGKFADAEASFVEATKVEPAFSIAVVRSRARARVPGKLQGRVRGARGAEEVVGARCQAATRCSRRRGSSSPRARRRRRSPALDALDKDPDLKNVGQVYAYASTSRARSSDGDRQVRPTRRRRRAETLKRAEDARRRHQGARRIRCAQHQSAARRPRSRASRRRTRQARRGDRGVDQGSADETVPHVARSTTRTDSRCMGEG